RGNREERPELVRGDVECGEESDGARIVVDLDDITDNSQVHFRQFAAELAPAVHSEGLKLMIALPARNDAYDYAFFGKECDAIVLMNYDEHWREAAPGPIASRDWYVENLKQIMEIVPPGRIIVAVAGYAYDWSEGKKTKEPAQSFTIQEALLHAYESETQIEFDSGSLNPHYSYSDQHDVVHQVWMLDAVTAYNELRASERMGVQGTAMWRLGSADTSLWPVWDAMRPDDATRQKFEDP